MNFNDVLSFYDKIKNYKSIMLTIIAILSAVRHLLKLFWLPRVDTVYIKCRLRLKIEEDNYYLFGVPLDVYERYLEDKSNDWSCGITSTSLYGEEPFYISLENSGKIRLLQCIPCKNFTEASILVKDDVYHNICAHLGIPTVSYPSTVRAKRFDMSIEHDVVRAVYIAPIITELGVNDVEELLLKAYLERGRILHEGDIFSIPLATLTPAIKCSFKYFGVEEIYFKVTQIKGNDHNFPSVIKYGKTDIYHAPEEQSYLVPKMHMVNRVGNEKRLLPTLPLCLQINYESLKRAIKPFVKDPSLCSKFQRIILLCGKKGSGKMATLRSVTAFFGLHTMFIEGFRYFVNEKAMSVIDQNMKDDVEKALKIGPCVLVIHDFDLLGKDKDGEEDKMPISMFQKHVEYGFSKCTKFPLIVIGLSDTNSDEMVPSLLRMILYKIKFEIPKADTIFESIKWLAIYCGASVSNEVQDKLVDEVKNFLYEDLALLVRHAYRNAILSAFHDKQGPRLEWEHFQVGLELMKRAYSDSVGEAKAAKVCWDEIGGMTDVKKEIALTLKMSQRPDSTIRRSGILLYGPPGTGKTLIAKAVATECGMLFFSVKGPELMNEYVGQSEKNVREVFNRAREVAPSIIFFDEFDSLAPNRGMGNSANVTDRVVSQLLTEMDGLQNNKGVFVIAATNRLDLLDDALLRPGRFDKMFYVGPFEHLQDKVNVLKTCTKKFHMKPDVTLEGIAELLPELVTGADIAAVCSNAWLTAARRHISSLPEQMGDKEDIEPVSVTTADFQTATEELVSTLTQEDISLYHLKQNGNSRVKLRGNE